MEREDAILTIRQLLQKAGFFVSDPHNIRSISFDLIARRDSSLLIIKVLSNVDSLTRVQGDELKSIASSLDAAPLIIGIRAGTGPIEEGAIYSRFDIPIINIQTLYDYLIEGVPPLVFAAPGGFYVNLDGEAIRRARAERGISLGTLAEIAGVSRKTIQMYESGMGAMIDVAVRLEDFLQEPIVLPIDPFDYHPVPETPAVEREIEGLEREIFELLDGMGYAVLPVKRCPFEAVTTLENGDLFLITGVSETNRNLARKARVIVNISRVAEKDTVIFIEHVRSRTNIEGAPLIGQDEIETASDPDIIIDLISERRRRKHGED